MVKKRNSALGELTQPPFEKIRRHFWGIILSGGDGARLQGFIYRQFNLRIPKQYCPILGFETLLAKTFARVSSFLPKERIMTIVNYDHVPYAMDNLSSQPPETVVLQPSNHDTGAGILLPLLHAYYYDPEAIVGIFPSDQFVLEERRYLGNLREAYKFASEFPGFIVMLGIEPTYSEPDYGLIQRGRMLAHDHGVELCLVEQYQERADTAMLGALQQGKCLWSASTFVGRAVLLLQLFRVLMPDVFRPFQRIAGALGTSREQEVTDDVYRSLPSVNFSRSVLERSTRQLAVLPVKNVRWSDWDEERQVRSDLARYEQRLYGRKRKPDVMSEGRFGHRTTHMEGTKPWFGAQ